MKLSTSELRSFRLPVSNMDASKNIQSFTTQYNYYDYNFVAEPDSRVKFRCKKSAQTKVEVGRGKIKYFPFCSRARWVSL